jgi:hypothetical protein
MKKACIAFESIVIDENASFEKTKCKDLSINKNIEESNITLVVNTTSGKEKWGKKSAAPSAVKDYNVIRRFSHLC